MAEAKKEAPKLAPKAEPKKLSDSERIDAIVAVLKANGMSLPKELDA